eukprot:5779275-Pyramimonas_sp.AAC.1
MSGGKGLCKHDVVAATSQPDRVTESLRLRMHTPTSLRTKFISEGPSNDIWFHSVLASPGNASTRTATSPR